MAVQGNAEMLQGAIDERRIDMARELLALLEAGRNEEADAQLTRMCGEMDAALFQEVGRLTRELHEAMNGFLLDDRVSEIALQEIPDAAERLRYVITTTEQAAHATLNAVEKSLPLAEELRRGSETLGDAWDRFRDRRMTVSDFKSMSADISVFLDLARSHSKVLHAELSEVLMAQGYQDITGQIIKRVIKLVEDLEGRLVNLVRITGSRYQQHKDHDDPSILEGPVVPGINQGSVVEGQDDVDDLLSSLGF